MAAFPDYELVASPIITVSHPESLGSLLVGFWKIELDGAQSLAWTAANAAYFYPLRLPQRVTVYQLLFWVGATSSGNLDVGIYDSQFNLIVSAGSTAMSATVNTVQELNIADTVLAPGNYWIAAAVDNTTGTGFVLNTTNQNDEYILPGAPVYEQTGLTAAALTNPGVPQISQLAAPHWFVFGIQTRSVF